MTARWRAAGGEAGEPGEKARFQDLTPDRGLQQGLQITRPWRCFRCGLYDAALILYPTGRLELAHEGCLYETIRPRRAA